MLSHPWRSHRTFKDPDTKRVDAAMLFRVGFAFAIISLFCFYNYIPLLVTCLVYDTNAVRQRSALVEGNKCKVGELRDEFCSLRVGEVTSYVTKKSDVNVADDANLFGCVFTPSVCFRVVDNYRYPFSSSLSLSFCSSSLIIVLDD